jgi:predicted permease
MDWETWRFVIGVTLPNLLLLLAGIILRRAGLMNDTFIDGASKIVFVVALPCLLFFSIATQKISLAQNMPLALYGLLGTTLSWLFLELIAPLLVKERKERGIFVQGGFRANTAIVGLAYASMAYGKTGIATGSLYMATTVILFNLLSVISLTRTLQGNGKKAPSLASVLSGVVKNPLIISLVLGLAWNATGLSIPHPVFQTGELISATALPLAMMCAGASLDLRSMFRSSNTALYASLARVVVVPTGLTFGGWLCGFEGTTLGVIFLFSATPAAAASYVMTRAMGGNAVLAANIIGLTMVGSIVTTSLGLFILRTLHLG